MANAPVAIFVHGGAWLHGNAAEHACLAEPSCCRRAFRGARFHQCHRCRRQPVPDGRAGAARGRLDLYRNAETFGGDSKRLHLISHSSGSHLAGCVVTSDWSKDGLPRDILKGAALSSGMYDLKPVRLSKRSKYVKFTDAMEQELAAMRHLDRLHTPLVLTHGTYETPEFQRQTRDFAAAVKAAGKPVELLVGEGYNHFEMLETLNNPYGLLGRAVFEADGIERMMEPGRRSGPGTAGIG